MTAINTRTRGVFSLLHRTASAVAETDHVAAQTDPSTLDLFTVGHPSPSGRCALEVFYHWVDDAGADSEDISDRGTATITFFRVCRVMPRVTAGALTEGKVLHKLVGTASVALLAFETIICDELMPGDQLGIFCTAMTPSAGAEYLEAFCRQIDV